MRRLTTNLVHPAHEVAGGTPVDTPPPSLPATNPIQPAVSRQPLAEIETGGASAPSAPPRRRWPVEQRLSPWLLRAGLAFVLSYAATSSLVRPETFARYLPSFLPGAWAKELLAVFAVFEALLAVGLMTYRYTYMASIVAGVTMVAIIVVNPHAFDVLFRNVAIACGAFALAVQSRR